jgi:hypothetical protein
MEQPGAASSPNGDDGHAMSDLTTVPLLVRRIGWVEIDRVIAALDDLSWLGPSAAEQPVHEGLRRIATDLEMPIHDGSATRPVRVATYIDIGPARVVRDHVLVEIAWHSALFAPLFPVFAGELRTSANDIVLDGRYAPPFGELGLLLDQAILHFVARRTAHALLARLAKAFENEASAGLDSTGAKISD